MKLILTLSLIVLLLSGCGDLGDMEPVALDPAALEAPADEALLSQTHFAGVDLEPHLQRSMSEEGRLVLTLSPHPSWLGEVAGMLEGGAARGDLVHQGESLGQASAVRLELSWGSERREARLRFRSKQPSILMPGDETRAKLVPLPNGVVGEFVDQGESFSILSLEAGIVDAIGGQAPGTTVELPGTGSVSQVEVKVLAHGSAFYWSNLSQMAMDTATIKNYQVRLYDSAGKETLVVDLGQAFPSAIGAEQSSQNPDFYLVTLMLNVSTFSFSST